MKYLKTYNESKNDENQFFYILSDILLEYFDAEGIRLLPDLDKIEEDDYESYLEPDKEHMSYGYYIDSVTGFKADNKETDEEIKSLGVWNITKDKVHKLVTFLEENRERIEQATGSSYTYHDEMQDTDQFDIYINRITLKQRQKDLIEQKLDDYSHKLKQLGDKIHNLPNEKRNEVFKALDELFKIVG